MKTVASFIEAYQAHILRGRLNSEGIPAFVVDDQTATINWMYSQAIGGVKVTVPDEYYEQARSILDENSVNYSNERTKNLDRFVVDHCPKCNSTHIKTTKYSWLSLIPSLLTATPIFFPKKKWHCITCGNKWK